MRGFRLRVRLVGRPAASFALVLAAASCVAAACATFGEGGAPDPSEAGGGEGGLVDGGGLVDQGSSSGDTASRCGLSVDEGFERDVLDDGAFFKPNLRSRSPIDIDPNVSKEGDKSLRIEVTPTADASAASFLRGDLTSDCVELSFWVKVTNDAAGGDLFVGLVSGPRLDGGTDVSKGANFDVRMLIQPGRVLRFGEQPSGGGSYNEFASAKLDDKFHRVKLIVDTAGAKLVVKILLDGTPLALVNMPALVPAGGLRTVILGPSFASASASALLHYDDIQLR